MNRTATPMQHLSSLCRHLARAWPLVLAAGSVHAATDWVDTHTKAFVTGPQLMARGAANEARPPMC